MVNRTFGAFLVVIASAALAADSPQIRLRPTGHLGSCSVAQWKTDWPGCEWADGVKEGRLSVVDRGGNKLFHVDYTIGEIGPEKGGIGWRYPIGNCEVAQMIYTVRFSKDFDWVKGGKLPGLCGGPLNVSGGKPANGTNGFSARLMWRAEGRGEAYVYHKNQGGNYGDSFAFPADFRFSTEIDIRVRMRVEMNTPGYKNGKLYVWIATRGAESEQLMVSRTNMEWRTVDTFGIDAVYFETFYGGGDKTWAPSRACWTEFGEIEVVK